MAFELTMQGKNGEQHFAFATKQVRVGRSSSNDLVIYDPAASRAHFEIVEEGDGHTLRDLGSSNGTKVNDRVAIEVRLRDGDRITVGKMHFEFHRAAAKGEARPPDKVKSQKEIGAPIDVALRKKATTNQTEPFDPEPPVESRSHTPVMPRSQVARLTTPKPRSWQALDTPRARRLLAVGAAALVLGGVVASVWVKNRPPVDRSRELFAADERNAALRFGAGNIDVSTPDKVSFQFVYSGGHVGVSYAVGGIDQRDELVILLNGTRIGVAPLSPSSWTTGIGIDLPKKELKLGANVLTFDNTLTPEREERWGVSQVQVTEEQLPPPDPKRAAQLYELGKTSYESRSVTPPNLWRAVEYLREARSYLEGLVDPPRLFGQVTELEVKAKAELQAIFEAHVFAAEKALRFGDVEQAVQVLRELLRYFPEPADPRHAQAKARLSDLGRGGIQ
jgi:hypothetical protein